MTTTSPAKAQISVVRSNGDQHHQATIGDGSIFTTVRVDCADGTVVLVDANGTVTTTTRRDEQDRRFAEARARIIPTSTQA